MNDLPRQVAMFCDLLLLGCTFQITREQAVPRVIRFYQIQACLLIVSASLGVWLPQDDPARRGGIWPIMVVVVLQLLLIRIIHPLLARATLGPDGVTDELLVPPRLPRLLNDLILPSLMRRRLLTRAEPEWLQRAPAATQRGIVLGILGLIFGLACMLAIRIRRDSVTNMSTNMSGWFGLAVAVAVCLIGLYNMAIRRDIITQVIGLLVMDHGLLLGVLDAVKHTELRALFVGGIFFYTFITLYILVNLLPRVRREGGSISLDKLSKSSELRG